MGRWEGWGEWSVLGLAWGWGGLSWVIRLLWSGPVWSVIEGGEIVGTATETGTETGIETGIGAWWDNETYFIACSEAGWLDLNMQVSWLVS